MAEFDPVPIRFEPSYFLMFVVSVLLIACAIAIARYAYSKLKDLFPSTFGGGEDW